ncbi:MAG: hypothetical protein JWM81_365 [Candidatus Saccharibacteria bacterium]|nr:hypothetical protein [Candidatus Saccharibacteria bacterium]
MIKVYVAGKISKESAFGTHYWRDDFCTRLEKLSGLTLDMQSPVDATVDQNDAELVFGRDSFLISKSDVMIVYLSDDISVGGSQEILIAKYFKVPVIGLAKHGGKFNGSDKEYFGTIVKNYKDPFVFTTCDVVCESIEAVAEALKDIATITPKSLDIIPKSIDYYIATQKAA